MLTRNDLFDGDKIRRYLDQDELAYAGSNKSFLKGLDKLKNDKKAKEAIRFFEEALLTFPAANTYYELGNALMEISDHKKALEAYEMAEKLNYEPFSKLLYNKACVYSQLNDSKLSAKYLEYSIQAGYMNIDNIEKDADLANLRKEEPYLYSYHLKRGLRGVSTAENIYWLNYKKGFAKIQLPLTFINLNADAYFKPENAISYDFEKYIPEMRDGRFSREVGKSFYYFGQVAENSNFIALVYLIRDDFMEENAPLSYRLMTYSHAGKLIDNMLIAGRVAYTDPLKMCKIKKDLKLEIDLFETVFEKDVEEYGIYENHIISKNKIAEEIYSINDQGKIVKKSSDLASIDK